MPPATDATAPAMDALSFEQALKELEEIVRRLEAGNTDLESSIKDYLRGTALQRHCQQKLADARLRIDVIITSENGAPALAPFDNA